jgi:hypothetical protein
MNTREEASIVARAVRAGPELRATVEEADGLRAAEDWAVLAPGPCLRSGALVLSQ